MRFVVHLLLLSASVVPAAADYTCVCNNGERREVFREIVNLTDILGHLNTSECKPWYSEGPEDNDFYLIQFQHELGFVEQGDTVKTECTGSAPVDDIIFVPETTWPAGTYGLMKAANGCPDVTWEQGWRKQDDEDFSTSNDFSSNIGAYLAGSFGDNIKTEFCIKTQGEGTEDWPSGTYCILKKNDCPLGFSSGYIYWDDEDFGNANEKGGTLPDGGYDSNTKIYYCCRNDGAPTDEIALPTSRPFVLIRYSATCQRVRNMRVTEVYVQWDDDDLFTGSDYGGMHPADDASSGDHLLHFCYYMNAEPDEPVLG